MIKKISILIIILLLTGCYDHQELNEISILTATELNKIDDNFIINAQIVNPQAPDKTANIGAPFIMYTGTGKTIQEAYRMIKLSSPRYIYPDHLRIVIINENLAQNNIADILDFYLRNPLARTEFNILIGKDSNILDIITPIDTISSTSILNTLETSSNYLGITNLVTLNELANMYLNPNLEIIIPSIKIKSTKSDSDSTENTQKTKIDSTYELSTLAIFKDNKLKGYLTNNQSITYNLVKNKLKNAIITYECEKDKYLSFEIINSKSTLTTKNKNIDINIDISGTINESACNLNLNNNQNIKILSQKLNNYLKNTIKNNIDDIRNTYNSDIFGFLDLIYKYDYNTYIKVKDNWYNNEFKTININIKPNIHIIAKGNVMEGINEKN